MISCEIKSAKCTCTKSSGDKSMVQRVGDTIFKNAMVFPEFTIHYFFLKLCQNMEKIVVNVQLVPPTLGKLWFTSSGGLLGLQTPHFVGAFSDLCPKCHYLCLYSGFMVLNSNLHVLIPDTSSFTRFGVDTASSLAKKQNAPNCSN